MPSVERFDKSSRDGTVLKCWRIGVGSPLVVANPIGIHPDAWMPVARELDGRFCFLLWEGRGLGGSAYPADPDAMDVTDHAADLRAIASTCGCQPFGLIAFCSAALVACEALQDTAFAPHRVMFISAPLAQRPQDLVILRFMKRVASEKNGWRGMSEICRAFVPDEFKSGVAAVFAQERSADAFMKTIESYVRYRPSPAFPTAPPLWLALAESDDAATRTGNEMFLKARRDPRDRMVTLPGKRYTSLVRPEEFGKMLGEWWQESPVLQPVQEIGGHFG